MNTQQAIIQAMELARNMTNRLLADLSDADLLVRPVDGANHIAWQLGHLASSEHRIVGGCAPGRMPALPEGFAEQHGREDQWASDRPEDFRTKDEYLRVLNEQREASKAVVESMSEADFDQPAPEAMRNFFPTVGTCLLMCSLHETMHQGQISAVRRKLGKPHAF